VEHNLAFEIKSREDFIGVFSECYGIVTSPRLSQVRRRQKFWAILSRKIRENNQDLGYFKKFFFGILPVPARLSQVRRRRDFFEFQRYFLSENRGK